MLRLILLVVHLSSLSATEGVSGLHVPGWGLLSPSTAEAGAGYDPNGDPGTLGAGSLPADTASSEAGAGYDPDGAT
jgi:hypothetical protein